MLLSFGNFCRLFHVLKLGGINNKPNKMPIKKEDTDRKKEQFLISLERNMNNISKTCKKLKMSRTQFYEWCKTDSDFSEAVKWVEEGLKDMAEEANYRNIKEGNVPSIIYYLKTKCKDRGYIEKTINETTIKGSGINIDIVLPDGDVK